MEIHRHKRLRRFERQGREGLAACVPVQRIEKTLGIGCRNVGCHGLFPCFGVDLENGSRFMSQIPEQTIIIEKVATQEQDRVFAGSSGGIVKPAVDVRFLEDAFEALAAGEPPELNGSLRENMGMCGH